MRAIVLLAGAVSAAAQTWIPVGPQAATLFDLALDPFDRQTLWAGTYFGGLYRTQNLGGQWTHISAPFDSQSVFSVAPDPRLRGRIYVGTFQSGAYRTDDAGATWTRISEGLESRSVLQIAADPQDSDNVLAATPDGVFFSSDAGASWKIASVEGSGDGTRAIVFHPTRRGEVFQGGSHGVFRSTDGGRTWVPFSTGAENAVIVGLSFSPVSSLLYAVTPDTVLRLAPGGERWASINDDLPPALIHQGVSIRPESNAGIIYISTASGVWVRREDIPGWKFDILQAARFVRFAEGLGACPRIPEHRGNG